MKCVWNIKELEENKKKLNSILNNGIDNDLVKYQIIAINEMLGIAHKSQIGKENISEEGIMPEDYINRYLQFINDARTKQYTKLFSPAFEPLLNIKVEHIETFEKHNISNETLVSGTLEFFKRMTNKDMIDEASKILTPQKHILYIKSSEGKNVLESGKVFPFDSLNKKYILLIRNKNTQDFLTLVHEMFHYIYRTFENAINKPLLRETESTLSELLAIKYLEDQHTISEEEINKIKHNILEQIRTRIVNLSLQKFILKNIDDNMQIHFENIKAVWDQIPFIKPFSIESVINMLKVSPDHNIIYPLGYLIAFDLFTIYKEDRDYAFQLLSNIIYGDDSNITTLLEKNHITFFQDGCKNIKEYYKK